MNCRTLLTQMIMEQTKKTKKSRSMLRVRNQIATTMKVVERAMGQPTTTPLAQMMIILEKLKLSKESARIRIMQRISMA